MNLMEMAVSLGILSVTILVSAAAMFHSHNEATKAAARITWFAEVEALVGASARVSRVQQFRGPIYVPAEVVPYLNSGASLGNSLCASSTSVQRFNHVQIQPSPASTTTVTGLRREISDICAISVLVRETRNHLEFLNIPPTGTPATVVPISLDADRIAPFDLPVTENNNWTYAADEIIAVGAPAGTFFVKVVSHIPGQLTVASLSPVDIGSGIVRRIPVTLLGNDTYISKVGILRVERVVPASTGDRPQVIVSVSRPNAAGDLYMDSATGAVSDFRFITIDSNVSGVSVGYGRRFSLLVNPPKETPNMAPREWNVPL